MAPPDAGKRGPAPMKPRSAIPPVLTIPVLLVALACSSRGAHPSARPGDQSQAPGGVTDDTVEVVTTIPVETTLSPAGTRQTATVWIEMIEGARSSIDMAQFYLSHKPGEASGPVLDALIAAAGRGVVIRVLTEKKMADSSRDALALLEHRPNLTVRFFDWKDLTGGILHAKYFVVDGKEAFVGSQNFDWRSLEHIHETGLRVRDEALAHSLESIFEMDWAQGQTPGPAPPAPAPLALPVLPGKLILAGSPADRLPDGVPWALDTLVDLIGEARETISIELLHYALEDAYSPGPFDRIDTALRDAAARGVAIHMLVSNWSRKEPDLAALKRLAEVDGVKIKFVTIPQASSGFIPYARVLHSKVMRVDEDMSWVGTSNWSRSYFMTSRNVEIVTRLRSVAEVLDALFDELWASPYACDLELDADYPPPKTH
jgi:phosphatidylserine/phosphatidylglycerophosphate/cardiolipin synthase-like enzyme